MFEGARCPANMGQLLNGVLKLGQRRGRWPNIKTALGQCIVLADLASGRIR